VLHPLKAIFLKERKNVEYLLAMGDLECLRGNKLLPENIGFLAQQLKLLAVYYKCLSVF
jgi:hypothetical protein